MTGPGVPCCQARVEAYQRGSNVGGDALSAFGKGQSRTKRILREHQVGNLAGLGGSTGRRRRMEVALCAEVVTLFESRLTGANQG